MNIRTMALRIRKRISSLWAAIDQWLRISETVVIAELLAVTSGIQE